MATPIAIETKNTVILSMSDEMRVLRKYAVKYPEVMRILLEHPKGYCPFLTECKLFPCENLSCKAEEISNGYPVFSVKRS